MPLEGPEGPIWLLEDQDLRHDAGWLIGTIAASHWWDASALVRAFGNRGARPKDFPADWTIDPLKLACLLRLADAAHLDGTRARTLAQALQRPSESSLPHWTFQRLLQPVRRRGDQLVFESVRPFKRSEAEAWWLCLDTLRSADRELRAVDALLADSRSGFRFAAKSVAGVDHPSRLAELIHTDDWTPVDARLHVSDLPSLVERLGGEQLYGDDPHVALREILQNAQDAVRARLIVSGAEGSGCVLIEEGEDDEGRWQAVSDDGVGMPVDTLTGSLLTSASPAGSRVSSPTGSLASCPRLPSDRSVRHRLRLGLHAEPARAGHQPCARRERRRHERAGVPARLDGPSAAAPCGPEGTPPEPGHDGENMARAEREYESVAGAHLGGCAASILAPPSADRPRRPRNVAVPGDGDGHQRPAQRRARARRDRR